MIPRNVFYSVAWDILKLPDYNGAETQQRVAQERVEMKRAIRKYATERGWNLSLISHIGSEEEWGLCKRVAIPETGGEALVLYYQGTLRDCCHYVVEDDIKRGDAREAGWE